MMLLLLLMFMLLFLKNIQKIKIFNVLKFKVCSFITLYKLFNFNGIFKILKQILRKRLDNCVYHLSMNQRKRSFVIII
jgi:hypothetical protein